VCEKGEVNMYYPSYNYYYGFGAACVAITVAIIAAIIVGCVLYVLFVRGDRNEKLTGNKAKFYNFLNFNKFYAEEIFKFFYIVSAAIFTFVGIVMLFVNFASGIILLVIGNIALRVSYELLMMFIILCRRTASVDKRLERILEFYADDFDEVIEDDGCCCEDVCDEVVEDFEAEEELAEEAAYEEEKERERREKEEKHEN
jgi:hypothetical protein